MNNNAISSFNGYILTSEFTTANAGQSRWAYCEKNGHDYFIKEFQSPIYPESSKDLPDKIVARKRRICETFFIKKSEIYKSLEKCRTGNNIIILDFFRAGSRYYIVTDRVDTIGHDPIIVSEFGDKQKVTLFRAILYSIAILHENGLVHADLKPDNILLKKTIDGYCTGKIVDFDCSFFEDQEPENIQGDCVYWAPETFLKLQGDKISLSNKIDVFSLGILFYQYWTGDLPKFSGDYEYVYQAVLDHAIIKRSRRIPDTIFQVILCMLERDPKQRPTAEEVLKMFTICHNQSNGKHIGANNSRIIKSRGFDLQNDKR